MNNFLIAPAGSGKTSRFIEVVSSNSSALALAFSNSAVQRVRSCSSITAYTFHSLAVFFLAKQYSFDILDDKEDSKLIASIAKNLGLVISVSAFKLFLVYKFSSKSSPFHPVLAQVFDIIFPIYVSELEAREKYSFVYVLHKFNILLSQEFFYFPYNFVAVDEFQDIDVLQLSILKQLNRSCELFCVADLQQSIYSWRGVNYSDLLLFLESGHVDTLVSSFRVPHNILTGAYSLVGVKGFIGTSVLGEMNVTRFSDNEKEFDFISRKLRDLSSFDVAILCRSNWLVQFVRNRLAGKFNLPPAFSFYESSDFLFVLSVYETIFSSFLKLNIKKLNLSVLIFLQSYSGIADRTIELVTRNNDYLSFLLSRTEKRFMNFQKDFQYLKQNCPFFFPNAVHFICERFGLFHHQPSADGVTFLDFIGVLKELKLNYWTFVSGLEGSGNGIGGVRVVTVHQSKGLEFDYVFIPCFLAGVFPPTDVSDFEEEKRVLLVALTRVKLGVFMTYSEKQFWRGGIVPGLPSPFLPFLEKKQ